MVGFECNRFVYWEAIDGLADQLKCGIGLHVLSNAVDTTKRRHTYRLNCIIRLVANNARKECPECRQPLTTRKRSGRL